MKLQNYLLQEEVDIKKIIDKSPTESEYAIKMVNQSFSWGLKTHDID